MDVTCLYTPGISASLKFTKISPNDFNKVWKQEDTDELEEEKVIQPGLHDWAKSNQKYLETLDSNGIKNIDKSSVLDEISKKYNISSKQKTQLLSKERFRGLKY